MGITISNIEVLALKKLSLICDTLANTLSHAPSASKELRMLNTVMCDIINRADVANHTDAAP